MDEKKQVKRRFNLLDAAIILVVLAALAFVAYKMMPGRNTATYEEVYFSFYAPDIPDFVADEIYIGAPMIDVDRNIYMGEVVDFKVEDSVFWEANDEGVLVQSSRDDCRAVTVTTRVSGEPSAYGIRLSGVDYSVGHTVAIRVGFAKMSGAICGVVYSDPSVPLELAKGITG